jgi:hypothetical protein
MTTYARASGQHNEVWAEELVEISDDAKHGGMTRTYGDTENQCSEPRGGCPLEVAYRNRKWLMSKSQPKKVRRQHNRMTLLGAHQAGRVFTGRIIEVACQRAIPPQADTPARGFIDEIQRCCGAWGHFSGRGSRVHKPSALVRFSLPRPLSFLARAHAMVAADRAANLDRDGVRVGLHLGATRHLLGIPCLQIRPDRRQNASNQRRARRRPMPRRRYRRPRKT